MKRLKIAHYPISYDVLLNLQVVVGLEEVVRS